jgi:archaeal flagellar protein FlaJ
MVPPEMNSGFDRFSDKIDGYKKAKVTLKEGEEDDQGKKPHHIRLPKGAIPYHESLNPWQKMARSMLVERVRAAKPNVEKLENDMKKAHMKLRAEDYIAYVWFTCGAIVIGGIVLSVLTFLGALFVGLGFIPFIVCVALTILGPVIGYLILLQIPSINASSRASNIDKRMAYAMSFISSMASADVAIQVIFRELAKQPIYGEITKEAQWITRDTDLLGIDVINAIKEATERTPSRKFADFLQGVITTTRSGGQLKPFFLLKADQFSRQNRMDMKKNMETLGLLAESFVVVVVAMPLFLIVMMSLMGMVGSSDSSGSVTGLWGISLMLVPLMQFAFVMVMSSISEEV